MSDTNQVSNDDQLRDVVREMSQIIADPASDSQEIAGAHHTLTEAAEMLSARKEVDEDPEFGKEHPTPWRINYGVGGAGEFHEIVSAFGRRVLTVHGSSDLLEAAEFIVTCVNRVGLEDRP